MKKILILVTVLCLVLCPLSSLAEMVKLTSGLEVSANIALADPELNSLTVAEL